MTLRGIDVSSHQPTIDWAAVAAGGYDFAIVKASGGTSYRNPEYHKQLAGARAAGLVVGSYHYAYEATVPGKGPAAEADYFLATVDVQPGDLVALDFEEPAATGNLASWALRWLQRVEAQLGFAPLFYTYPDYIRTRGLNSSTLAVYPLWWASYDDPPMPAPSAWGDWAIWQYSGGTNIPGIPNDTDANIYPGTRAELLAMGKPGAVTDPGFPGALQPDGHTVLNGVDFAGTAVCVEEVTVRVRNAADERYERTWVGHHLEEWKVRP